MIKFHLPDKTADGLDALLERQANIRCALPFNDKVQEFVATLSRAILTDRGFRAHPELMAMAHWFRPANLLEMRERFFAEAHIAQRVYLARGVVFHIAPSNVDSVFIYSWLLSLLCGNSNIARVSRRSSPQMQLFFSTVGALLEGENITLAAANLVLSYDHDAALTEKLSSHCDVRVIWGGDNTIRQIRAIPLPPLSGELAFANRFSLAVIDAQSILNLDSPALTKLASAFYNDAFWFNQQACSSPRAVIWIGQKYLCARARDAFWSAVADQISLRQPENQPGQVMNRVTTQFRIAHEHVGAHAQTAIGALPSRILLDTLTIADRECHDGNGLFIEIERTQLCDIIDLFASRDQTVAYFGFERTQWLALLPSLPPHAADRIVPIGRALAFNPVWDGVDLLRAFTREINL